MPRPPLLPLVDWKAVFESGKPYEAWLDDARGGADSDSAATVPQIEANLQALTLEPQVLGFLGGLARKVHVVAIAETWCGDVVRHAPALRRLEEAAPLMEVRFVARAQWPDVFARFLTNGGEAIPKFIFLSEAWVECANWGPMPEVCKEFIARGKATGNGAGARKRVSALYDADPQRRIVIAELLRCLDIASALGF